MSARAEIFGSFSACILKSTRGVPITNSWQSAFVFDVAHTSRNQRSGALPGRTPLLFSGPGVEKFEMKFPKLFLLAALLAILMSGQAGARETLPWLTDLPQAQVQARTEGKWVLIHFSGSDWCGWCMKLHKDVFQKAEFASYAKSNLVLVSVDFPKRKPQPPAVQQANQKLAAQYQVQGPPTLIVLDSQGRLLGKLNYGNGGTKAFIAEMEKVIHTKPDVPGRTAVRKTAETEKAPQEPIKAAGIKGEKQSELELRRISGPRQRRQALINEQALSAGETATFHLASGRVKVRCVEIRERSVLVLVGSEKQSRELRLSGGT
jgi:thioredoxin-related protein